MTEVPVYMEVFMADKNEYSQEQTYQKGDVIYHPVFKDTGKIKKIDWTVTRIQKLYVDFEKKGSKILIAGKSKADKKDKKG